MGPDYNPVMFLACTDEHILKYEFGKKDSANADDRSCLGTGRGSMIALTPDRDRPTCQLAAQGGYWERITCKDLLAEPPVREGLDSSAGRALTIVYAVTAVATLAIMICGIFAGAIRARINNISFASTSSSS